MNIITDCFNVFWGFMTDSLPNHFTRYLPNLGVSFPPYLKNPTSKMSGVNFSQFLVGPAQSFTGIHVENLNLASVNFLDSGHAYWIMYVVFGFQNNFFLFSVVPK
jgi:hypothetical protein